MDDGSIYGSLKGLVVRNPEVAQTLFVTVYMLFLLWLAKSYVVNFKTTVWNPMHGKLF